MRCPLMFAVVWIIMIYVDCQQLKLKLILVGSQRDWLVNFLQQVQIRTNVVQRSSQNLFDVYQIQYPNLSYEFYKINQSYQQIEQNGGQIINWFRKKIISQFDFSRIENGKYQYDNNIGLFNAILLAEDSQNISQIQSHIKSIQLVFGEKASKSILLIINNLDNYISEQLIQKQFQMLSHNNQIQYLSVNKPNRISRMFRSKCYYKNYIQTIKKMTINLNFYKFEESQLMFDQIINNATDLHYQYPSELSSQQMEYFEQTLEPSVYNEKVKIKVWGIIKYIRQGNIFNGKPRIPIYGWIDQEVNADFIKFKQTPVRKTKEIKFQQKPNFDIFIEKAKNQLIQNLQ